MSVMGRPLVPIVLFLAVLAGCGRNESEAQRHQEANSPAGKVGKAAHSVAKETGKAARAVGRELGKAAHDAKEGWKEAERQDKAKSRDKN